MTGTQLDVKRIRGRLPGDPRYFATRRLVRRHSLDTVCVEAGCPNRWECFARGVATILIMGRACTRACSFCGIARGRPAPLDADEPARVARLARDLRLRHLVITSVARDDIPDMGASHFSATVRSLKASVPRRTVEVLAPDFNANEDSIAAVVEAGCDVFSHNMETVRRLFPSTRPSYDYDRSLSVLALAGEKGAVTKSGIMLGLGEEIGEVRECIRHIRDAGCGGITIGQYLRPTRRHRDVARSYSGEEFHALADYALSLGFRFVASAPRVRSSYRVDCFFPSKEGRMKNYPGGESCDDTRS